MKERQKTVKKSYTFEGKGLHTGLHCRMTIFSAPSDHGIVFKRTDFGQEAIIEASWRNIAGTARSTALSKDGVDVITIEHLLAAFSGLGIDNALVAIDSAELPILDGSSRPYVEAFLADGLHGYDTPRRYLEVSKPFLFEDPVTGSSLQVLPADSFSAEVEIDYGSKVLGVQKAQFAEGDDFASAIAPCRTFCFLHELEFLLNHNLIKGGDMDNAIVVVENDVDENTLRRLKTIFNVENLERAPEGYLNNLTLHFENECARHKLLDVIGDFALAGLPLKARIIARKPGHSINTAALKSMFENNNIVCSV
jgi:UDP-3-O-[3-hydroxymyristoyl] N-acetylglucosamine deacetylase/3-hydroxyacyl-[acyl-carrier-protein] dehydratase